MFTAFSVLLTLFTFLATFNAPALHVKTAYWKLDAGDNNPDITPYGVFLAIGLCLSFIGVIVYSILAFVNKKTKRLFKYRYTHLTFYTALAFLTLIVFVVGVCDKITYDVNGNINNLYLFAYNPDLEGWTLTNAGKAAVGILGSLFIITTIGYLLVISSLVKLPSLKVNVKIGKAK
jgi:membrane-associated HD superfamily phosphohydrolase